MKTLEPNDLHFVFNGQKRKLKLFDATGKLRYTLDCRNETTMAPSPKTRFFGHHGHCPPGNYVLADPSPRNSNMMGPCFIELLDVSGVWKDFENRSEIGIHGGGSGLRIPQAPRQGWMVTYGCLRLQNEDLLKVEASVNYCHAHNGHAYITVSWDE